MKVSEILIKGKFCQNVTKVKGGTRRLQAVFCISVCMVFQPTPPNERDVAGKGDMLTASDHADAL